VDKSGRCVGLTNLSPSSIDFHKSGNLNLLEPEGSVEACDGIALPFFTFYVHVVALGIYTRLKVTFALAVPTLFII
jgi:hypothetical protein